MLDRAKMVSSHPAPVPVMALGVVRVVNPTMSATSATTDNNPPSGSSDRSRSTGASEKKWTPTTAHTHTGMYADSPAPESTSAPSPATPNSAPAMML